MLRNNILIDCDALAHVVIGLWKTGYSPIDIGGSKTT